MTRQVTPSIAAAARPPEGMRPRGPAGVVLLEVVLALALFFGAALVVLAGLNASLRTAQRVRLEAEAADLAVTLLSEIQMGLVPPADDGPNEYEYEGLADWTWELVTQPFDEGLTEVALPEFLHVEIVIRHVPSGYTYRLGQLISSELQEPPPEEAEPAPQEMETPLPGGRRGRP